MQNPLRRPKGNPPAPRDHDMERNKNNDTGYLAKDVRGHLVAMSGEFVGTFMFLYFAFAATQIASTSNLKPIPPPFWEILLGFEIRLYTCTNVTSRPLNRKS